MRNTESNQVQQTATINYSSTMISRSCQDSRLHTDAFRSSKGSRLSTDSRITTSGKPDGKKCAFECWLPDRPNCSQSAVKFRSAAGVSPTLCDVRSKQNRIHSCRFHVGSTKGDVGNWDANGANTDHLTARPQTIKRMIRSAGCGYPSTQTRFSVQPRSCSSRPLKTISSRASSSSFSSQSYCTVAGRDMHKHLAMENTNYETKRPASRFSLFRANCRRETGRLRPDVDIWCSALPHDCSREAANCSELQFNLHGKGRGSCSEDTLPMCSENTINTNIEEAAAHIETDSFQRGNDVGEEISMLSCAALLPEDLHVLRAEHTHQLHSDAERCWNKLWNNIPPSGVEENQSMVKLRQMAGKLIESLICKIKLQLDSGTQLRAQEDECEQEQHRLGAARSEGATSDCEQLRGDASDSKHCGSRQAIEKLVTKEQSSKAEDQKNTLVSQSDAMQPIICRSVNQQDNDTEQGLHRPSEIKTTMAKSDSKSLSRKKTDDETGLHSESRLQKQENGIKSTQGSMNRGGNLIPNIHITRDSDQNKSHESVSDEIKSNKSEGKDKGDAKRDITSANNEEIRGASSNRSVLSVSVADEAGSEDNEEEDEDEEETDDDKLLQNGSHQSIYEEEAESNMRVEGQQKDKSGQSLRNNDHIEKTEAVKYHSMRPQPSSASATSEASASSIRNEHEPKFEAENNSLSVKGSVGNNGVNKKGAGATSSQSVLSNREDLEETIEHATMDPETEATLKSFASEVVQSLYTAIRYKLKNLVQDSKDEAKKLEIMQKGDIELKDQILPTIIEHIVWIIKEEFRGQDESEWKHAMLHDPGQYLDTIVTNAVMKTHADHMAQRSFLKTFVVTSNFKHSAKWKF